MTEKFNLEAPWERDLNQTPGAANLVQVQRTSPSLGRKTIWFLVLGVLAFLTAGAGYAFYTGETSVPANSFDYFPVRQVQISERIAARARAVPSRTVFVDARVGGVVESIEARNGQQVTEGDAILTLTNRDITGQARSEEIRILERRADLDAKIAEAYALAEERAQDHEALEVERETLERRVSTMRELYTIGATSRSDVEEVEAELAVKNRDVNVMLAKKRRADAEARRIEKVNKRLIRLLAEEAGDRSAILEGLTVSAPVAGRLTGLDTRRGESVEAGQRLGQIDSLDDFTLRAMLDEFHRNAVIIGQPANMTDAAGRQWLLSVEAVEPEIKAGQFEVDLFFETMPPDLRRGQSFNIFIESGTPKEILAVPDEHADWLRSQPYLYVFDTGNGTLEQRPIQFARELGGWLELDGAISEGERLVVSSRDVLKNRERLNVR